MNRSPRIAVAGTGGELAEACRDQHSNLLIADIRMPEMDGIDAAARIYRDGPIPVILVSAHYRTIRARGRIRRCRLVGHG